MAGKKTAWPVGAVRCWAVPDHYPRNRAPPEVQSLESILSFAFGRRVVGFPVGMLVDYSGPVHESQQCLPTGSGELAAESVGQVELDGLAPDSLAGWPGAEPLPVSAAPSLCEP